MTTSVSSSVSYEDKCRAALKELTKPVISPESGYKEWRDIARNRKTLRSNVTKKLAESTSIRARICMGLKNIEKDLDKLMTALVALFVGLQLTQHGLTPEEIAMIALIISKFGIGAICGVSKKHDKDS